MRKEKATGGVNEAVEDEDRKNQRYTYQSKVNDEAEEKKHGGSTKRRHHKRGGKASGGMSHKEGFGPENETTKKRGGEVKRKEVEMHGEHAKHHAGRKPRKSGGRASSDQNPYSSARSGTEAKGRSVEMEME